MKRHTTNLVLLIHISILLIALPSCQARKILDEEDAQHRQRWGWYPSESTVPEKFILFNETTMSTLERVASPAKKRDQRAIIFTTLRFGHHPDDDVLGMISTFCYHLNNHNMLKHTMLITTDERTWTILHERGFPAYLDRSFPRREEYIDNVFLHDTDNREFDVEKHWWGWRMTSLGFRVLYMDSDAVVLKNPLIPFEQNYEIQGLSDWENLERPQMDRAYTLADPCKLYYIKHDDNMPSNSVWSEEWTLHRLNTGESAFMVTNPCQSTGIWYLKPTEAVIQFMNAMVDRIGFHELSSWPKFEWDQTAWNDIILHFLWGAGEYEPLRYRLLPFSQFANILTHRSRKERSYGDDPVVLHLGGIHGKEKIRAWQDEGYWKSDFVWDGHDVVTAEMRAVSSKMASHGSVMVAVGLLIVVGVVAWKKLRPQSGGGGYKAVQVVSLQP